LAAGGPVRQPAPGIRINLSLGGASADATLDGGSAAESLIDELKRAGVVAS